VGHVGLLWLVCDFTLPCLDGDIAVVQSFLCKETMQQARATNPQTKSDLTAINNTAPIPDGFMRIKEVITKHKVS